MLKFSFGTSGATPENTKYAITWSMLKIAWWNKVQWISFFKTFPMIYNLQYFNRLTKSPDLANVCKHILTPPPSYHYKNWNLTRLTINCSVRAWHYWLVVTSSDSQKLRQQMLFYTLRLRTLQYDYAFGRSTIINDIEVYWCHQISTMVKKQ